MPEYMTAGFSVAAGDLVVGFKQVLAFTFITYVRGTTWDKSMKGNYSIGTKSPKKKKSGKSQENQRKINGWELSLYKM